MARMEDGRSRLLEEGQTINFSGVRDCQIKQTGQPLLELSLGMGAERCQARRSGTRV